MKASVEFAESLKTTMGQNLNRIDLLTDAKISDIKGILKAMND